MKVLLIQPKMNWPRFYCETPSIGLLTLAAMAVKAGHEVKVIHHDIDNISFSDYEYDLVGVTCNTFQVKDAREIVGTFRNHSNARIVIGGPHAVAWDKEVDGDVDDIVIGEGEKAWAEIVGCDISLDINDIPTPEYSLVDMSRFCGVRPLGAVPSMVLFGARGCPGKCIFCNTPVFWGSKPRYRDPESIIRQIEFFQKEFGAREVFFQDDTFNSNLTWAAEIFERIIDRKLNQTMVFRIDCRTNEKMLTEEFVKLAQKAGVWSVFLGIESGSQKMLDSMKKHATVEENKRAVGLLHRHGLRVQAAFVVGLPGESWETIQATQDFINETRPDMIGWGFATPFPATELDRIVTEEGHKLNIDYADYKYGQLIVRTDELDYQDLALFSQRGGYHYAANA